jgi:hypothetical protein
MTRMARSGSGSLRAEVSAASGSTVVDHPVGRLSIR